MLLRLYIKVFVGVFVALCIFNTNVSAMMLSQPVKLGEVFSTPSGGFIFKGASSNIGKSYINERWSKTEKVYEKGVAIFGTGEDALYVHYDDSQKLNVMFGNRDGNNTFNYEMIELTYDIRQIRTDSRLVLYALDRIAGSMGSTNWIILGRLSDGTFVKYFETDNIRKQYFPNPRYVDFTEVYTQGNTIIIRYKYFYPKKEHNGEFRFKWDDTVQWFGIEQVVY